MPDPTNGELLIDLTHQVKAGPNYATADPRDSFALPRFAGGTERIDGRAWGQVLQTMGVEASTIPSNYIVENAGRDYGWPTAQLPSSPSNQVLGVIIDPTSNTSNTAVLTHGFTQVAVDSAVTAGSYMIPAATAGKAAATSNAARNVFGIWLESASSNRAQAYVNTTTGPIVTDHRQRKFDDYAGSPGGYETSVPMLANSEGLEVHSDLLPMSRVYLTGRRAVVGSSGGVPEIVDGDISTYALVGTAAYIDVDTGRLVYAGAVTIDYRCDNNSSNLRIRVQASTSSSMTSPVTLYDKTEACASSSTTYTFTGGWATPGTRYRYYRILVDVASAGRWYGAMLHEAAGGVLYASSPAASSSNTTIDSALSAMYAMIGAGMTTTEIDTSPSYSNVDTIAFPSDSISDAGGGQTNFSPKSGLDIIIDGGGAAISTGIKADVEMPFAGTIRSARLLADQTGSIVVNIWKAAYSAFPPTVANKITASAPPTISAATKSEDTTLTGWTTTFAKGDIMRFNVDSAATVTRVTLSLVVDRS